MTQSTFNAEAFLQNTVDKGMDTALIPVPEGPHKAQVVKLSLARLEARDGKDEATILEVTWEPMDESVKKATGLDHPQVRQAIWLDLTPQGGLDASKGKNVQLGKLREAVGQNKDGKKWTIAHLNNAVATILVEHRPDKNDPSIVYANVKKVAAA